jgi:hypothetical protein
MHEEYFLFFEHMAGHTYPWSKILLQDMGGAVNVDGNNMHHQV